MVNVAYKNISAISTCKRLKLEVVDQTLQQWTTTSISMPEELPSVEEALKMLAGALASRFLEAKR